MKNPPDMEAPDTTGPVIGHIPRQRMIVLFLVMLVTAAGNTAMQSVMPAIGTRLQVNDVWVNLAYSWSALLWVAFSPFWARRSDRRGRKAMMAVGMAGFISSFALCAGLLWIGLGGLLSPVLTLGLFALARGTYGAFGCAAPPAVMAYVASRTPPAERTQAVSLVSSSFSLGTVIGPAVAPLLILPGLGLTGPFVIFTFFGIATLVALRLGLPQDNPAFAARGRVMAAPFGTGGNDPLAPDEPEEEGQTIPRLSWHDRRLRPWVVAGLLGSHAQAALVGIVGFLVLDRLGLRADPGAGSGSIGLVLMCGALATLLAQWGIIPMFKLGPRLATLSGIWLSIAGVIVFALAQDLHAIALGYAIASAGFGIYRPGFFSGGSLAVTRHEQGQVAGIIASVSGAAYIVAPALGVWLYNHSEPAAFGAIVATCALVLVLGYRALAPDAELHRDGAGS
jgi:MFS family permease